MGRSRESDAEAGGPAERGGNAPTAADVEAYMAAKAAYDADPVSYSLEEVEAMLGLEEVES